MVKKASGKRKGAPKTPVTRQEWRQTGTCPECQADGVPCDELGNDCEDCDRSDLDTERKSRQRFSM